MPAFPRLTLRRVAHRIADEDVSRPLWRHPATIAAAALALTLGAVPLLPDGATHESGGIAPTAEITGAPGAVGRGAPLSADGTGAGPVGAGGASGVRFLRTSTCTTLDRPWLKLCRTEPASTVRPTSSRPAGRSESLPLPAS